MKEVVGPFACDSHESQNVMNHSVVAFCNRSILCDSSFLQVYLRIGRVYQHLFFPVYLEACGPLKFSLFFDMRVTLENKERPYSSVCLSINLFYYSLRRSYLLFSSFRLKIESRL